MNPLPLKAGVLAAAVFCLLAMTSCTYDPYGTAYASYTYSNYPYGYTTAHLPYGYTSIYYGGTRYWHCNGHYYRHYPGRGYVVVKRPPGHYRHSSHRRPVKYAHSEGNRYHYQNRPNYAYRGGGSRAVPSARHGSVNRPSRASTARSGPSSPRTVRAEPAAVQPRYAPSSSRKTKRRATNQSSTWDSSPPSGDSTIRRNPSNSQSGMSRRGPSRSNSSGRGGGRGRF